MKTFTVYILQCSDGSYYTGLTSYLEQRLEQHQKGFFKTCYTFSRRPVTLRWHEEFQDFGLAVEWEKKIKGWRREKKQALMENRFEDLVELSKNYSERSHP